MHTLDGSAFLLNEMLYGPLAVSLLCAGAAMWRSALFPRALPALAAVAGLLVAVDALVFTAPRFAGIAGALSSAALVFWIWMLWAGVLLWRRTPSRATAPEMQPVG